MNTKSAHPYTFDELQAFADNTLETTLSGQIEQHLASCPECRSTVAKLRVLEATAAQALTDAAPEKYFDTFSSRVSSRIAAQREAPRAKRAWFAWWGLVPAAAAAVLVLLIALNPEHSLRQQLREASKANPVTVAPPAQRTVEPSVPRSPAAKPVDDLALSKERQAQPEERSDKSLKLAAKDELASSALRADKPASPTVAAAVPARSAATGGFAEMKRKAPAPPAAETPQPPASCAPLAINQRQVIVIHLPDGPACPQPEIGTAIEIVLPTDCPVAN